MLNVELLIKSNHTWLSEIIISKHNHMLSSHVTAMISYTVHVAALWVFCPSVGAVAVAPFL